MANSRKILVAAILAGSSMPTVAAAQSAVPGAQAAPARDPAAPANQADATASSEGVGAPGGDPSAAGATGDIIVTATRRSQNLQDIPIAISAIGSQALESQKITNVLGLSGLVPGLQVNRNNAQVTFTLRGVGSNYRVQGVDTTVAAHTDGIYISAQNALTAAFFDIDRVEVVKGPQGVLYGRNASGGAVNLISRMPTDTLSGYALGTYGNFNAYEGEAVISGPIVEDKVLFRVGGYLHGHDGYGRDLFLDTPEEDLKERGAKGTLQFKPTERFEAIFRADYYKAHDHNNGTDAIPGRVRPNTCLPAAPCAPGLTLAETRGGITAPDPHDTNSNIQTQRDLKVYGFSGELNYDLTDQLTLKSLTGYRYLNSFQQFDNDVTQVSIDEPFTQTVSGGQFSQELQAHYHAKGVYGILGAYYFHEKRDVYFDLKTPALNFLPPPNYRDLSQVGYTKTRAFAVFANADIDVMSNLTVGIGGRYSSERRGTAGLSAAIFGPATIYPLTQKTFNAFTPRFTVDYKATPDITLYGSVSRGFKSGQFGISNPVPAKPEFLWDYEGGVKGKLLDGMLRFSLGGYYYDFKDIQLQLFKGPVNVITNADGGKAYGAEVSLDFRLPAQFRLHGDASYEHSKYQGLITDNPNIAGAAGVNVDLGGNRFPYTPSFAFTVALEKDIELGSFGKGTFRVEDQYNSKMYLDIYQDANAVRNSNHIFNASYNQQITPSLSVLLFAKNFTNKTIPLAESSAFGVFGSTRLVNYNAPRTYGVTARFGF